ncbi:MAG: LptF/LptG family permease [Gemmataceae bacterium]|nr:LptF/LptG family permease [Gemmataceae bacterium]
MTLLDRQLILSYVKAYLICLVSLLSLYIVVDLFTNIEDFAQHNRGLLGTLQHIGTFYGYKVTQIFDRLSEAITLLAAMFTVAWMQRNNELLPLLSAGISTQRVVRPVLLSACAMLGLTVSNQELLIPHIANSLFTDRDDSKGDKEIPGPWGYAPNGIHVEGRSGVRKDKIIRNFCCTLPENMASGLVHLSSQEARYVPPSTDRYSGGWLMTNTTPPELENWSNPGVLEMIDSGKYFLHTLDLDFDTVTRGRNWFIVASTYQLYEEMCKPDSTRLSSMAVLFHMRLTRPIMGMLLIFLGLSMILRDQNRNIFISAGMCLIMCAVFFGACFLCKHLGNHDILSPALAAWLPVLFFGPLAFVLFDAIQT